jgi:inosine-uridine nucleoside N-ribohydrolase
VLDVNDKKIPVILDTDIGNDIDDTWALGMLLKCPELDVKLITTASDNTTFKAKLVAKFLDLVGRTDIPIGIGVAKNHKKGPLYRWVKEYDLASYPGIIHEHGVEALCSTIMESPEPITLIVIGPCGNIAEALRTNPDITKNARFVGMQGSVRIGYMGVRKPAPEFNVQQDIQACREVFQAPWEKTITPLDTCGSIVLSGRFYKPFLDCDNSIVNAIKENYDLWAKKSVINKILKNDPERNSTVLFDTVAIYLAFSEELLNIEELKIEVTDKGLTQISEKGNTIRCATSWKNKRAFKELLVDRLMK